MSEPLQWGIALSCPRCRRAGVVSPMEGQEAFCACGFSAVVPNEKELQALREEVARLRAHALDLEKRRAIITDFIPQTIGDAVMAGWPVGDIEGHEWDNRTSEENAVWMLRQALSQLAGRYSLTQQLAASELSREAMRAALNNWRYTVLETPTYPDDIRRAMDVGDAALSAEPSALAAKVREALKAADELIQEINELDWHEESDFQGVPQEIVSLVQEALASLGGEA